MEFSDIRQGRFNERPSIRPPRDDTKTLIINGFRVGELRWNSNAAILFSYIVFARE